ncbi:helix-turn-helix domain-containing protein [Actinokineospora soli]|uniref:Helix-turn-helix domain-containing protein n=1 Tax=Actinokineospora soli TaxID=1048753 RepID=A0ABW2TX82_9PSEU
MAIGGIRQPEFGRRLRKLRQERRLSQRDVAGTVVNPSYISLLESGARVPTLEVVLRIAEVLDVPVEELAGTPVPVRIDPPRARYDRDLVHNVLVRSALDVGALDEAQARHERVYTEAVRDGVPAAVLEHGIALQDLLNQRGDHQARHALLTDLLRVAEDFGVVEILVKLRLDMATAARDRGDLGEAVGLAEAAVAALPGTELAGTPEHVRALGILLSVRVDSGETGDVAALVERMLSVAEQLGSPTVLGRSHWAASVAFARVGDAERTERHIRRARSMLTHPDTSIREWGRFAGAAASALLDADGDLSEIETYVSWMRAALELVDIPGERDRATGVEARYALRSGHPELALELTEEMPGELPNSDRIRLRRTRGRALSALGRTDEAIEVLRTAAELCERLSAYRLATVVWREIDEIRSGGH